MYFPIGWPKQLKLNDTVHHLAANNDKSFVAILGLKTIKIWLCKPNVELVNLKRSNECLKKHGVNISLTWKPNSQLIAVSTSKDFILFYKLDKNKNYSSCYEHINPANTGTLEEGMLTFQSIPSFKFSLSHLIQIHGGLTSMAALREDLVLASRRGLLQRVAWMDARFKSHFTIELASVPFSTDLQQSRATPLNDPSIYVKHLEYSAHIGGFAIILSNGKAAFLASHSPKFEPNQVVGLWAQETSEVTCLAVNHKFSLIAFADKNGEGTVYQMDGATGSLVVSHRLAISSKDLPDARQVCGGVAMLKYCTDGAALAMAWCRGSFAVWSVFGSLLFHSTALHASSSSASIQNTFRITSMEWACEGYHLWMVKNDILMKMGKKDEDDGDTGEENIKGASNSTDINSINDATSSSPPIEQSGSSFSPPHTTTWSTEGEAGCSVLVVQFVKSCLFSNPFLGNQVHLLLQADDRLYLNPEDALTEVCPPSHSSVLSNRQWHVLSPPPSYLANNWPIRFAAMSSCGHWLAVAGRRGFSHYSLLSRRWKMFGNETQEQNMEVSGGLAWWEEFVCVPCTNLLDQRNEIRLYSRDSKLDNASMSQHRSHSATTLTNVFLDLLITLSQDCTISIFALSRENSPKTGKQATMSLLQELNIDNFIPHPSNVLSVALTSLRTDSASCEQGGARQAESILINVAGRLLLFQRDRCLDSHQCLVNNWLAFTAPVVVASSVETVWLSWKCNQQKPHLTDALWLGCGASGVKVWLPLELKEDVRSSRKGFLSKRIMLPFHADIHPLAMLFEAGIILGVMTESMPSCLQGAPSYLLLEKTSQIYLHHILRQLLRRNLGIHALELARSCTSLAYFPHVLELLVHEVLEEEATSKEPIPDALLPRVVAFVEEFPEYLQTIAHCARKSDAAVWQSFFSVVGSPADLFQNCLQSKELTTASSYLIILQNLENPVHARQHAIALLDAALDSSMWDLARDLVRYLSAIVNDSPATAIGARKRQNSQCKHPGLYTPSPASAVDSRADPFMHATLIRGRSLSKDENFGVETPAKSRQVSGSGGSAFTASQTPAEAERLDINCVLDRHARKVMSSYGLCQLARFAANLDTYHLVTWLRKERSHSAKVDDFVAALKALHHDFQWPLPSLPTLSSLSSLSSTLHGQQHASAGSSHVSSHDTSCNGDVSSDKSSHTSGFKRSRSYEESEDESTSAFNNNFPQVLFPAEVDKLCMHLMNVNAPSGQASLQLRYLYQILMEAECLEWALVVSIMLQDTSLFSRTVATAYLPSTPHPTILRMLQGSQAFVLWSQLECPGYCNLVASLKEDLLLLESLEKKVVATSATNKRASLGLQQQHASIDCNNQQQPATFAHYSQNHSQQHLNNLHIDCELPSDQVFHRHDNGRCEETEEGEATGGDAAEQKINPPQSTSMCSLS